MSVGQRARAAEILVLHDYFATAEGGGRLSSILARALGADLGYGFARLPHPFVSGAVDERDLRQYSRLPLWQQFKLARAFAQADFVRAYKTVIYSGFYTPLAIQQRRGLKNILYCHTPPRFIYDQRDFYRARLAPPLRPLLDAFIHYLQPRYETAAQAMDIIIANSDNVRRRVEKYLGLPAQVVYPPCATERFQWRGQDNYYLSTARLDPLKRVDMIVRAFLAMPDKNLVVTSGGSELARLRKLAGNAANIRFTGWLSEAELADWMGNALAVLYLPCDEDFGMSPVEAMAAGKPVIGAAEGGLLETIQDGESGFLITPSVDALQIAVRQLGSTQATAMRSACEARAQIFRTAVFLENMRAFLS
jgi:glycosyltransferase involved in cell wall biosynthesis